MKLQGPQAAQKGPDARRRPTAAREAYSLYVTLTAEGANEADGPFSAACYNEPMSLQAAYSAGSGVEPVAMMSAKSMGFFMASFFLQRMKKYGRSV